jgi:L-iditol 2-dehydrogenase
LRVRTTGVCGSDLHSYADARIGDTALQGPLVLGHEFSAVVEEVGPESLDGRFTPLEPGRRVAVDPAQPCGRCEMCEAGHPNLCRRLHFCGNYPDGGSLCEFIHMPARSCFPVPDEIDDEQAALLEPLGVAIHAVDLARIRVGDAVGILGAGCIGLMILQVARAAGAGMLFVTDQFDWRLRVADSLGATAINFRKEDALERIRRETQGRGLDVVIEAAWGDESVSTAAEMARLGGRLVLVGIPSDDQLRMKHSTARRKGLTIRLSRRMKHVYPRAIDLVRRKKVDFKSLISHRFNLADAPEAFRLNTAYRDEVVKTMIASP